MSFPEATSLLRSLGNVAIDWILIYKRSKLKKTASNQKDSIYILYILEAQKNMDGDSYIYTYRSLNFEPLDCGNENTVLWNVDLTCNVSLVA